MRRVRSQLKIRAQQAAVKTFGTNLKCLLLTRPYRNELVLGIDPSKRRIIQTYFFLKPNNILFPNC